MPAAAPSESPSRYRLQWSISTALAWGFGLLIVIAVGTVLFFSLHSALKNTMELTSDKAILIVRSVAERTRQHLEPAEAQVRHLSALVEDGTFDPNDKDTLYAYLTASLAAAPQIRGAIFIPRDLQAKLVIRDARGLRRTEEDWSNYPPVLRALPALQRSHEAHWGAVIHVPEIDGPGTEGTVLNVSMPVRRGGEFAGAFAASVKVGDLSRFLGDYQSGYGETPFILSGFHQVLAHPNLSGGVKGMSVEKPLPFLLDVDDPVLSLIWDKQRTRPSRVARRVGSPEGIEVLVVNTGEKTRGPPTHVIIMQKVLGFGPVPWIIGCHFRSDVIGAELSRLDNVAYASLGVLLLAVASALVIGRLLRRPVARLAEAARSLRAHGPGDLDPLPGSHVLELDSVSHAFNEMVEGLRDRELIRATFGKYVPESIAGAILEDKGMLQPTTRLATVLFTDIAAFSTISEELPPPELIALLNDYFSVVMEPIERHGGVIQQFQGDAILATYNLPVEDPEHAAKAVRTALEIQEVLAGRRFGAGDGSVGVELATRVGINTGTVVGGTVGAGGRLGYTVHGDEVNLAARIEQLNKEYGTRVLVAQATVDLAGPEFRFEAIGEVRIRGRNQSATVYRVAGMEKLKRSSAGR